MNGNTDRLYEMVADLNVTVATIQTKQEENHMENREDIKAIFEKLNIMPCQAHVEKFKHYDRHLETSLHWRIMIVGTFLGLVCQLFYFAFAWGQMKTTLDAHKEMILDNKNELFKLRGRE